MSSTTWKIIAVLTMAIAIAPAALAQTVNGRTLSEAYFNDGKARIAETGRGEWTEFDAKHNPLAVFKETSRDDWSVYLSDDSRKIRLQLDVHRKMIGLAQNGGAMGDYYPMTSMSADPLVTGYKVMEVQYPSDGGGGTVLRLVREASGKWVVMSRGTRAQESLETGRTEWTVRLEDKAKKTVVELDCLRKIMRFSQDGAPMQDYFPILRCSSVPSP